MLKKIDGERFGICYAYSDQTMAIFQPIAIFLLHRNYADVGAVSAAAYRRACG
jgi:hypothetical protein